MSIFPLNSFFLPRSGIHSLFLSHLLLLLGYTDSLTQSPSIVITYSVFPQTFSLWHLLSYLLSFFLSFFLSFSLSHLLFLTVISLILSLSHTRFPLLLTVSFSLSQTLFQTMLLLSFSVIYSHSLSHVQSPCLALFLSFTHYAVTHIKREREEIRLTLRRLDIKR